MKIASLNVKSGGFDTYDYVAETPQRMEQLQEGVRKIGAHVLVLVDTFGWNVLYSDEDLQEKFGYEYAINVPLEDDRLRDKNKKRNSERQIGVALLSNLPVISGGSISLDGRNAVYAQVVPDGEEPIGVGGVYLDDLSKDKRREQASDLRTYLGDSPRRAVLAGDFNDLTRGEKFSKQSLTSIMARVAISSPHLLPYDVSEALQSVQDMRRGEAITLLKEYGLIDAAGSDHTPTAPTHLFKLWPFAPRMRVDYMFHTPDLIASNYQVLNTREFQRLSDHYPITAEINSK